METKDAAVNRSCLLLLSLPSAAFPCTKQTSRVLAMSGWTPVLL